MIYNKAITFIVPLPLSFLLKVGQEPRDQSDKGHIATDVIDRLYTIPVAIFPNTADAIPATPKAKPKKSPEIKPNL